MGEPQRDLDSFIAKYTPEIQKLGREVLEKTREIVPSCTEMVYDNYNGLVVGFCPDDKPSNAVFSVLFVPRWVTLCFLQGAGLPDPDGMLRGEGNLVRSMRISSAEQLDEPEVRNLMTAAMASAKKRFEPGQPRKL